MANYEAFVRTNYFRVTDEERYQKFFSALSGEDEIHDFSRTKGDIIEHGFGCYGWISYYSDNSPDGNMEEFYKEIQKILPDNNVFILMESGHEKLRYITGFAAVVSKTDIRYSDIHLDVLKFAREMLNDPKFEPDISY